MAKIKIGDIYEIKTKKGKGYFQLVSSDKLEGELIRVFYKLFDKEEPSLQSLIKGEYYLIGFPLKYALKQDIVKFVRNIELPPDFKIPRYMRTKHKIGDEFLGWYIVDRETLKLNFVEQLDENQKKLSPHGIVNDTYLIERFEEDWRLEDWL
jgi:hypothetical protein